MLFQVFLQLVSHYRRERGQCHRFYFYKQLLKSLGSFIYIFKRLFYFFNHNAHKLLNGSLLNISTVIAHSQVCAVFVTVSVCVRVDLLLYILAFCPAVVKGRGQLIQSIHNTTRIVNCTKRGHIFDFCCSAHMSVVKNLYWVLISSDQSEQLEATCHAYLVASD